MSEEIKTVDTVVPPELIIGKPVAKKVAAVNPVLTVDSILALNPCTSYNREKIAALFGESKEITLKLALGRTDLPYTDLIWLAKKTLPCPKYENLWLAWETKCLKSLVNQGPIRNLDEKKTIEELRAKINSDIATPVLKLSIKEKNEHAIYVATVVCDSMEDKTPKQSAKLVREKQQQINLKALADLLK